MDKILRLNTTGECGDDDDNDNKNKVTFLDVPTGVFSPL